MGSKKTGANKVCHPWNHPLMGSRSLNSSVQKGWYEHDGKPDLHLGGWSKHAFKGHCFVCELKNIRTCMHSTTPRLWAVPPWHCHHVPHKTKTDIVLYSCKTKQAGHAGTTLLRFSLNFRAARERKKSKCFFMEACAPESMLDFEMQIIT